MRDHGPRRKLRFYAAFYRLLLRCYPAHIRRQFGIGMLDVFNDMCAEERERSGRLGSLVFSLRAYAEVPLKAAAAHRERWFGSQPGNRTRHMAAMQSGDGSRGTRGRLLESVARDVRFAVRALRKRPLFTAVAAMTLGLGIGMATAMFSVVDAVLLKGLLYRDAGRLVTVWQVVPRWRDVVNLTDYWDKGWLSFAQYRTWFEDGEPFLDIAIHDDQGMTLTGVGEPERLAVGEASASLLRVLGVEPPMGRWFLPGEEGTEASASSPVAVLSYELWQRRFGGDPDVLGTTLTSSERTYTIVGVLPRSFRLRMLTVKGDDGRRDVWVPIDADQGYHWEAVGRLAPGVSIERAEAATRSILLAERASSEVSIRLVPRKESEILGFGAPLVLLLTATGLLLLIACTNIATLSLGEVLGRRQEIATRLALGASRSRIVRQLITESVVLGVLGSAVGAALAVMGTRMLVTVAPPIPRIDEVGVDLRVLVFATSLGVLSGLVFGTIPPLVSGRGTVSGTLRTGVRSSVERGEGFGRLAIAAEVALTVVILVAGGLLARSLALLMRVEPGFDSENLLATKVLPRAEASSSQGTDMAFYDEVVERIRVIPGVRSATVADGTPFFDGTSSYQVRVDHGDAGSETSVSALGYRVGSQYFEVMNIPIVAGRAINEADGSDASLVAVVSESMARHCWPTEAAVGGRFQFLGRRITVVGVAGNVRHEALDRDPVPTFYVPAVQHGYGEANFIARTAADPRDLISLIRQAVWSVDRDVPILKAGALTGFISQSAMYERYRTLLMSVFGIAAVVLAAVGVLGVTARAVAQRTRELGIRMALGARESGLISSTVRASLVTGLAGTVVGLIGVFWASLLLSRFLFGVDHSDPVTYVGVAALVLVVCLVASYVPARRIARLNPVDVLRAE